MKYTKFNEIYQANIELDGMFEARFTDNDMIKKNKIELLVEIGELANETRYFKYWSDKPIDIDLVKGEFADCVIMTFYFFNILHINLDEEFGKIEDYDKLDVFGRLYKLASSFYYTNDKKTIKELFVTIINFGYLIGFTDDDIIDACMTKINKNKSHFR